MSEDWTPWHISALLTKMKAAPDLFTQEEIDQVGQTLLATLEELPPLDLAAVVSIELRRRNVARSPVYA